MLLFTKHRDRSYVGINLNVLSVNLMDLFEVYGLNGVTKQSLSLRIFIVLKKQISDEMDAKEIVYQAAWK